jgi:hypothetical protein
VLISGLDKSVMRELKCDAQLGSQQPDLDQDADVTSVPDLLSNTHSRRTPTEVHYVA